MGDVLGSQRHSRTRHPNEVCEVEQFLSATPREDVTQRVGTGDEEQVDVAASLSSQILEGVDGVRVPRTIDVDP